MSFLYRKTLPCLILLFAAFTGKGQSYYFKHYKVDDGLSHNTVTSIVQDRKGLMWIGTKGGLNSFDGYTFKSYKNTGNKFGTIGNNFITSVCEDLSGMIWIGTERGIFKYDTYKETVSELAIRPISYIKNIVADKANNLWFISENKVCSYNQHTKKITYLNIEASCLSPGLAGELWIGTFNGSIKKYNPGNRKVESFTILNKNLPPTLKLISKIYPVNKHEVLIGTTKQGLKSYNTKTGRLRSLLAHNEDNTDIFVRDIISAGKDTFWIATESGIYIYNLRSGSNTHLKKRTGDSYSISDNAVYSVYQDSRGGVWVGTFFGGLNYFSPKNARFKKYYPVAGNNSVTGNAVREICSGGPNTIWIGTEDAGISKFDMKTQRFTNYTADGKKASLSYPNVHGLCAANGKLYIGLFQNGLEIMDISTGHIIGRHRLISSKDNFSSDFVISIYQTADGSLLIGTGGAGLYIYDPEKKIFNKIGAFPASSFVYAVIEDHEGTIWTGSLERGTFYYNPKTGKEGNIRFNRENKGRAANDYAVQGIFEDSKNFLWFTTEGGGLIRISPDRKQIKKYTTEDGLPTNNLFRILEDADHNLWISSLKGLICLNPKNEDIKVYTQSNGLITDQFNYNSAFKDEKGNMYFGAVGGMIVFNPAELENAKISPSVYITEFQINNEKVTPYSSSSPLKKSILYTDTLVLKYDQANFNIEFAALVYSSPEAIRYKYIMKGLDKNWTYLTSNRKAYFTDLSPGDYTFVVAAESNTGSWQGKERTLFIKILPPLWKSYPAWFIYFFASLLIVYFSIRYYKRSLEKKNLNKLQLFQHKKEKEIYQAKIEFFTNIAHEIQTPLTLIKGPLEWTISKADDPAAVKRNLKLVKKNTERLITLTSQLLDFRKAEIDQYGLNFVAANINYLLSNQIAIFKPQIVNRNTEIKVEMPKEPVKAFVDREAFNKIIINLISNAIKYSDKYIAVSLYLSGEGSFKIRITNDGDLITAPYYTKIFEPFYRKEAHKSLQGTGIGLPLAKALAELHNGTLCFVENDGKLNIFELTIPLHQEIEFELSNWKNINKDEGSSINY